MRTIRLWGRIFRNAASRPARSLFRYWRATLQGESAIIISPYKIFWKTNTRINLLYTEVLLVIAINLTLAFGSCPGQIQPGCANNLNNLAYGDFNSSLTGCAGPEAESETWEALL